MRAALLTTITLLLLAGCDADLPQTQPAHRPVQPGLRGVHDLPTQRFATAEPEAAATAIDPDRRQRVRSATTAIDSYLREQADELHLPGLAAAVVLGGEPVMSVNVGVRDLKSNDPVKDDTVFRIGSITKTFTGLALLHLRDAGRLTLDDPVARFVPEISRVIYPTADSPRITIRHLVTHTSGLPRLGKLDYVSHDRDLLEHDVLSGLDGLQLLSAPGTLTEYSNLAMGIGGLVVQRASGQRYRDYVSGHLLEPLGMTSSFWSRNDVPADRLATGYRYRQGEHRAERHWRFGAAEGLGGLYSTSADLSRYVAFQLQAWPPRNGPDEGPVKRATLRESQLVLGHGRPTAQTFGANWGVLNHPTLGFVVSHTGGTYQYCAAIKMLPQRQLGVVVLANTGGEAGEVAFRLSAVAAEVLGLVRRHDPDPGLKLSDELQQGMERVHSLLNKSDDEDIDKWFAESFLEAIPKERLSAVLEETRTALGKCTKHEPIQRLGEHAAVVRLSCEKGSADVTLYLAPNPPHPITGFAIKGAAEEEGETDDDEEDEDGDTEEADDPPAPAAAPKARPAPKAPKSRPAPKDEPYD